MNAHNEKTQMRKKRNTIIEKTLTLHCVECRLCAKRYAYGGQQDRYGAALEGL